MGGDFDPLSCISPIGRFLNDYSDTSVTIHCTHDLADQFHTAFSEQKRIIVQASKSAVSPHASPLEKSDRADTTMYQALNSIKSGGVAISSGSTGVLMALARRIIGKSPGVSRPSIAAWLPNLRGSRTLLLDVGANLALSAEHLHELALEASRMISSNGSNPRVGLINVGTEHSKGTRKLRKADTLLKEDGNINYVGYVEPNSLFDIECDLVVTDGYSGNLLIKSAEGVCHFTYHEMIRSGVAIEQLVESRLDYRRHNGAVIVGLNKPVIKSHGGADEFAFYSALVNARHFIAE